MKAKRKYSYSALEYIITGWAMLLLFAFLAVIFCEQIPGEMPQIGELEHVNGVHQALNKELYGKSSVSYDIVLEDGGVHGISTIVGFSRRQFEAAIQPGDTLLLCKKDGFVVGIYDAAGNAVLSIEEAWKAMERNEALWLWLCIVFFGCGAGCLIHGYEKRSRHRKHPIIHRKRRR